MFCDLAGSATLSSRLDPEDLGTVIRTYQARVREAVARFDGFIARYVGDGVLIYFGWPEAHETDAEKAVVPRAPWPQRLAKNRLQARCFRYASA